MKNDSLKNAEGSKSKAGGSVKMQAPAPPGPKPKTQDTKSETAQAPSPSAGDKAPAPPPTPEQQEMSALLKEMEGAMFSVRFFPVAVNEQAKGEALARLETIYSKGNETVRQMLLYMVHDVLATSADLKTIHTLDYFRMKNPSQEASAQRVSVYRAMFNYNSSIEGLTELIRLLGRLRGGDDSAKLLTYHFSHLCAIESEANHMLRSALLEALGESESKYALMALLDYARYTDSERTFNRVVSALTKWEGRIEGLKLPPREKEEILKRLKKVVTSEFGGSHYG